MACTTILLTLMMLSQVSDYSRLICAVILLRHRFSPVTINPRPSLLALCGSLCMTVSYLTSYQFALLVLISVVAGYSFQTPRSLIFPGSYVTSCQQILCHGQLTHARSPWQQLPLLSILFVSPHPCAKRTHSIITERVKEEKQNILEPNLNVNKMTKLHEERATLVMPNIQGMPFEPIRVCLCCLTAWGAESDQQQGCGSTQRVCNTELSRVRSGEHC